MRVLHVISSMEIGGAQRLLSDLLPLLKQDGIDVSLLVLKTENTGFTMKILDAGVPIISLDVESFRNPLLALKIRDIIRNYDIVHAHLVHALYLCSIAARGLNIRLVYTEHSTSNNRRGKEFMRPIEKWIYGRYEKLISISEQTQTALQSWLQSKDKRFVVIHNGVDTKVFSSKHCKKIPYSLIMVSRFASSKDQETVIRAMKMLHDNVIIRFVGDGENLERCKQAAKEIGVGKRVSFLGARTDVANLVAESLIGIQSSNWEGFGLTAVEMMAAGLPVIATEVDGLKQVVEGAGLLFKVGDEKSLADNVNSLLGNITLYEEIAKKCRERALQYDIIYTRQQYARVYKSLL